MLAGSLRITNVYMTSEVDFRDSCLLGGDLPASVETP